MKAKITCNFVPKNYSVTKVIPVILQLSYTFKYDKFSLPKKLQIDISIKMLTSLSTVSKKSPLSVTNFAY